MPKFVARKPEKEVISMRIDTDVLKDVDQKAAAVGISRNELLNQMILYALSNMDEPGLPEGADRKSTRLNSSHWS